MSADCLRDWEKKLPVFLQLLTTWNPFQWLSLLKMCHQKTDTASSLNLLKGWLRSSVWLPNDSWGGSTTLPKATMNFHKLQLKVSLTVMQHIIWVSLLHHICLWEFSLPVILACLLCSLSVLPPWASFSSYGLCLSIIMIPKFKIFTSNLYPRRPLVITSAPPPSSKPPSFPLLTETVSYLVSLFQPLPSIEYSWCSNYTVVTVGNQ